MSSNNQSCLSAKFQPGYYLFASSVLIHISGTHFNEIIGDWCYDMEIIADKTKSFGSGQAAPTVTDFDRIINTVEFERLESKGAMKSLEVLFTATESTNAWESGINEEPIVSEAGTEEDDV